MWQGDNEKRLAYLLNKRSSEGRLAYERKEENLVRTNNSESHVLYSYCDFPFQKIVRFSH